jgi:hypothetical protein
MPDNQTASIAKNIFGDSLYQERARIALPILVRQAAKQQTLTYADLAQEIALPNPRNLNYILGSIGTSLNELSKEWREEIPPIQCLVVNKVTGLPGEGVDEFLTGNTKIQELNRKQKKALVDAALAKVFAYPKWIEVLKMLNLKPTQSNARPVIEAARKFYGGGESEAHLRLKQFVANNPSAIGLPANFGQGQTEFTLPSGDSLDVLFRHENYWIAAEVKSRASPEQDIVRGLFQCVKYYAVLDAWRGYEGEFAEVRAILVLETKLPSELVELRNALGVEVVENINTN